MAAIGDLPRVKLTHYIDGGASWGGSWFTYVVQPIPAPRPGYGYAVTSLRCARCGLPIDLRISSARIARWRRRAWLTLFLMLMSASALFFYWGGYRAPANLETQWLLGSILGSVLTLVTGPFVLVRALMEDGVWLSLDGQRWRRRLDFHGLRLM